MDEEPRCLQEDDDCEGEIELFAVPGGNPFYRCAYHIDKRMESYENSDLERYAHSDVAPSWFDPDAIGEHWHEDDY